MNCLLAVSRLYVFAAFYNSVLTLFARWCYAGRFSLLMDPLSWLGKVTTDEGLANTPAALLFGAGLLFNMYVWKKFMAETAKCRAGRIWPARTLQWFVFYGFFFMAFPCDVFVVLHSIGGGLLVGGLWALATMFIYHARDNIGRLRHLLMHGILHLTTLYCFYHFVLDTPLKGFSQKPLILAIVLETGIILNELLQAYYGRGLVAMAFTHSYKY